MSEAFADKVVFTIPVFGGIDVSQALLTSWGIILFIILLCVIFVRRLKIFPNKKQSVIEIFINWVTGFFSETMGERGKPYIPILIAMLLFIVCSNVCGIFGFTPPTKSISVSAGLALISITLVLFSSIRNQGPKKWIKSYTCLLYTSEIIIRPLSLCLRLFGNVIGAYIIMELIKQLVPIGIPILFSLFFDVFDGVLQAYVFVRCV